MNDRKEKIFAILNRQGSVSVEQLKRELFASEATVRRDLKQMEQEGLLIRKWGGALSLSSVNNDPPLFVRSNANVNAKNAIARAALRFLESNMTLFLASGTTVARLAKFLHKYENLTVITNGLDTVSAMSNHLSARILLTGGEVHENYDLIGGLTESAIEQFNADLFFFSCSGITSQGFTSMDSARLEVIKRMKKNSAKTVLLADSSKVGKKYTYKGFGFEEIDYVILESKPRDAELRRVLGEKLIVAR